MSVIEARAVTVRIAGRAVVDGVSLSVAAGQLVGLIGPNGSGKTTLVRALIHLQPTDGGQVCVQGQPVARLARRHLARTVAYLPQGHMVQWPVTVARLVALGRLPHLGAWQRILPADREAIRDAMDRTEVTHLADRRVNTLSGGERARVMLARALAVGAPALIADEPIASVDPYHQLHVMELLRNDARAGAAVVVVLHDLTMAARFCDALLLLRDGRVLAFGDAPTVLAAANLEEAYGVAALRGTHEAEMYVLPWRRRPAMAGPPCPAPECAAAAVRTP